MKFLNAFKTYILLILTLITCYLYFWIPFIQERLPKGILLIFIYFISIYFIYISTKNFEPSLEEFDYYWKHLPSIEPYYLNFMHYFVNKMKFITIKIPVYSIIIYFLTPYILFIILLINIIYFQFIAYNYIIILLNFLLFLQYYIIYSIKIYHKELLLEFKKNVSSIFTFYAFELDPNDWENNFNPNDVLNSDEGIMHLNIDIFINYYIKFFIYKNIRIKYYYNRNNEKSKITPKYKNINETNIFEHILLISLILEYYYQYSLKELLTKLFNIIINFFKSYSIILFLLTLIICCSHFNIPFPFTHSKLSFILLFFISIIPAYIICLYIVTKELKPILEKFDYYWKHLSYIEPHYYKFMCYITNKLKFITVKAHFHLTIIYFLIPYILCIALVIDIFYFNYFIYILILISLLLFLRYYIIYSMKIYYKELLSKFKENVPSICTSFGFNLHIDDWENNFDYKDAEETDDLDEHNMRLNCDTFIKYYIDFFMRKNTRIEYFFMPDHEDSFFTKQYKIFKNIPILGFYKYYDAIPRRSSSNNIEETFEHILLVTLILEYYYQYKELYSFTNILRKLFNIINNFFKSYGLIILGLTIFGLYMWFRFIRERLPRDIPFNLSTLGFILLLYTCFIYIYIIYSYTVTRKPSPILNAFIDFLYTPLKKLDYHWKHLSWIHPHYIKFMYRFVYNIEYSIVIAPLFYVSLYLIPRYILLSALLIDILYLHQLFYIYKVLLVGLLLFLRRYIIYSIKMYLEELLNSIKEDVECIETPYVFGVMPTEWPENLDTNTGDKLEQPKYTHMDLDIDHFIEYYVDHFMNKSTRIEYSIVDVTKEFFIIQYKRFNVPLEEDVLLPSFVRRIYYEELTFRFEHILFVTLLLDYYYRYADRYDFIKTVKTIIFALYLFCWSYILFKSASSHHVYDAIEVLKALILQISSIYVEEPFSTILY